MSPGPTFERVYHALKEQLGSARFAAGEHLEPATLSHELNASITPVRDALHRLVGEGLVEAPRGDGFRVPVVTEVALRHLYRWNGALLDLAARSRQGSDNRELDLAGCSGAAERIECQVLAIAGWTGNPEHVDALARLNDRLRTVRRRELDLLGGVDQEIESLAALVREGPSPLLRRALAAFHRRRERIVAEIVAALVSTKCRRP